MIHVTIFGGHDGRLLMDKLFYLTLFGGCDLVHPTVARQLLAHRKAPPGEKPRRFRRAVFLTLFGGVDLKLPTLAEEFLDLRQMLESGVLTLEDWDRAMADIALAEPSVASLTIFGGFDECALPSEEQEIDSLALQRHLGNIPASAGDVLQYGIGQKGAERRAAVRRAVAASV